MRSLGAILLPIALLLASMDCFGVVHPENPSGARGQTRPPSVPRPEAVAPQYSDFNQMLDEVFAEPGAKGEMENCTAPNTVYQTYNGSTKTRKVGKMPKGFFYGMVSNFAANYCKDDGEAFTEAWKHSRQGTTKYGDLDTLKHYGMDGGDKKSSMTNGYALLMSLGMLESSGQYNKGIDKTATHSKASEAEAGLFQVSYNSVGFIGKHRYNALAAKYFPNGGTDGVDCMRYVYGEGVKLSKNNHHRGTSGAAVDFQKRMKNCPAFATDYMAALMRRTQRHNGPLKRKEAQPRPGCVAFLERVANKLGDPSSQTCGLAESHAKNDDATPPPQSFSAGRRGQADNVHGRTTPGGSASRTVPHIPKRILDAHSPNGVPNFGRALGAYQQELEDKIHNIQSRLGGMSPEKQERAIDRLNNLSKKLRDVKKAQEDLKDRDEELPDAHDNAGLGTLGELMQEDLDRREEIENKLAQNGNKMSPQRKQKLEEEKAAIEERIEAGETAYEEGVYEDALEANQLEIEASAQSESMEELGPDSEEKEQQVEESEAALNTIEQQEAETPSANGGGLSEAQLDYEQSVSDALDARVLYNEELAFESELAIGDYDYERDNLDQLIASGAETDSQEFREATENYEAALKNALATLSLEEESALQDQTLATERIERLQGILDGLTASPENQRPDDVIKRIDSLEKTIDALTKNQLDLQTRRVAEIRAEKQKILTREIRDISAGLRDILGNLGTDAEGGSSPSFDQRSAKMIAFYNARVALLLEKLEEVSSGPGGDSENKEALLREQLEALQEKIKQWKIEWDRLQAPKK